MNMQRPFTSDVRQQILLQFFETFEEADALACCLPRKTTKGCVELRDELWQLRQQYFAGLPVIPISRCPYCQQIIHLGFDYFDLDGLFWSWEYAFNRPRVHEIICPHFWTLSGALKLSSPIIYTPFQIRAGSETPCVMRSALQHPDMQVVISSVKVANHTAYPILYFSASKPICLEKPFPEWLSSRLAFWVQDYGRTEIRDSYNTSSIEFIEDADFDLASWIQKSRVFWISPDDTSLSLKKTLEDCPYINLPGERESVVIQFGEAKVHHYMDATWRRLDIS